MRRVPGILHFYIKSPREEKRPGGFRLSLKGYKPSASFQGISFKLADMATEIEAADLLTLQACDLKEKHMPVTKASAMAKYYASEVAVKVANDAVQIFGGYGYTKDYPAEKYWRDSKLLTIGEGTSEIQRMVIGKKLLQRHKI